MARSFQPRESEISLISSLAMRGKLRSAGEAMCNLALACAGRTRDYNKERYQRLCCSSGNLASAILMIADYQRHFLRCACFRVGLPGDLHVFTLVEGQQSRVQLAYQLAHGFLGNNAVEVSLANHTFFDLQQVALDRPHVLAPQVLVSEVEIVQIAVEVFDASLVDF